MFFVMLHNAEAGEAPILLCEDEFYETDGNEPQPRMFDTEGQAHAEMEHNAYAQHFGYEVYEWR